MQFFTRSERPVRKNHTVTPSTNLSGGTVPNHVLHLTGRSSSGTGSFSGAPSKFLPDLGGWICNSPAATNVLFAGQEAVAMERMLTAFWDEDRQEVQVRRPSGQVFRFSTRQAVAGGHEVFGVQTDGNDVWVLTGAAGSRRPTWKVRFTQTGTYRGNSAL